VKKERRIYKIPVGHIDGKDVKEYMENMVKRVKNVTTMGPGIVYTPYVPLNVDAVIEDYFPKQKILKVKEWLRLQRYGQKTINKDFYTTFKGAGIPEIDLKIESRTVETEEWKVVAGVAVGKVGQELKLTEEEAAFNKISEGLKKRGI